MSGFLIIMRRMLILSSFTIDYIVIGNERYTKWGGPAFYAAIPPLLLDWNLEVYAICGKHFPWSFPFKVNSIVVEKQIVFEHVYLDDSNRISRIISYPETTSIRFSKMLFQISLVSPVFREFPAEVISTVDRISEIVGVDIQGFLRREKNGKIFLEKDEYVLESIQGIHVLKMDLSEYHAVGEFPAKINLITLGGKGAIAKFEEGVLYVPAYYVKGDPTGAGDVFLSSFLIKFFETRDVLRSLAFSNALASLLVEGKLINRSARNPHESLKNMFIKKQDLISEIEKRMEILLDKAVVFSSFEDAIKRVVGIR